jgi:large subunit ribosomal protein L14e
MIGIGQVCIKIAGRDAGLLCAVIEVVNDNYVIVDGATRRRKCNVKHLEPMMRTLPIKKNAAHDEVVSEMNKAGFKIEVPAEKREKKEAGKKPVRQRKSLQNKEEKKEAKPKKAPKKEKKEAKKEAKKE